MQAFSAMRKAGDSNQGWGNLLRHVDLALVPIVLGVAFAALAAERALAIEGPYAAGVSIAFIAGAAAVLRVASRHLNGAPLGAANRITLVRGALAALAAGLLLAEPRPERAWFAVGVIALALALDGVDGALARRFRLETAFGARFDMETDALTILILCALAWRFGRAGVWVLLGGLLRYAFVAAGSLWPWLKRPLPPSRRRQTACVLQIVALVACLAPVAPARLAASIAALGLAAIAASFAADVLWLRRAPRTIAS
ncbi:MAG TPA: CDP-alcohol phosphatidyltransferase family protein [Gammaproteobacteria bacterium]|nr:CDP-alcohol phosphatidyltransferase family protein [Gammaproteobacteria bacterium]